MRLWPAVRAVREHRSEGVLLPLRRVSRSAKIRRAKSGSCFSQLLASIRVKPSSTRSCITLRGFGDGVSPTVSSSSRRMRDNSLLYSVSLSLIFLVNFPNSPQFVSIVLRGLSKEERHRDPERLSGVSQLYAATRSTKRQNASRPMRNQDRRQEQVDDVDTKRKSRLTDIAE